LMVVAVGIYVLSQAVNAQLMCDVQNWFNNANSEIWLALILLSILVLLHIGNRIHKADTVVFKTENTADGH